MLQNLTIHPSTESRSELVDWLNGELPPVAPNGAEVEGLRKVEQCGSGVPYVLLLPTMLPLQYPPLQTRLKVPANHEFESVANWKLVQDALQRNGITKPDVLTTDTQKLLGGNFQANLKFLQWFRGLQRALLDNDIEAGQGRVAISPEASRSSGAGGRGDSLQASRRGAQGGARPVSHGSNASASFSTPHLSPEDLAVGKGAKKVAKAPTPASQHVDPTAPRPKTTAGKAPGTPNKVTKPPAVVEPEPPAADPNPPKRVVKKSPAARGGTPGRTTTATSTTKNGAAAGVKSTKTPTRTATPGTRGRTTPKKTSSLNITHDLAATTPRDEPRGRSPSPKAVKPTNGSKALPAAEAATRPKTPTATTTPRVKGPTAKATTPLAPLSASTGNLTAAKATPAVAGTKPTKVAPTVHTVPPGGEPVLLSAKVQPNNKPVKAESDEVKKLRAAMEQMEMDLQLVVQERQFYYDKLRSIENLVTSNKVKAFKEAEVSAAVLARSVRDVLYAN